MKLPRQEVRRFLLTWKKKLKRNKEMMQSFENFTQRWLLKNFQCWVGCRIYKNRNSLLPIFSCLHFPTFYIFLHGLHWSILPKMFSQIGYIPFGFGLGRRRRPKTRQWVQHMSWVRAEVEEHRCQIRSNCEQVQWTEPKSDLKNQYNHYHNFNYIFHRNGKKLS